MRAVVVLIAGEITASDPSFGVLADKTVGKVVPPSVESRIRTLAAFIGATSDPPTLQVTIGFELRNHVVFVFGAVKPKGPVPAICRGQSDEKSSDTA